jgi:hypothetical protein
VNRRVSLPDKISLAVRSKRWSADDDFFVRYGYAVEQEHVGLLAIE